MENQAKAKVGEGEMMPYDAESSFGLKRAEQWFRCGGRA